MLLLLRERHHTEPRNKHFDESQFLPVTETDVETVSLHLKVERPGEQPHPASLFLTTEGP